MEADRYLQKGSQYPPIDIIINLRHGDISDYPFDAYKAKLEISAVIPPEGKEDLIAYNGATTPDGRLAKGDITPVSIDLDVWMLGFDINVSNAEKLAKKDDISAILNFKVKRSKLVLLYALFVMGAIWGLALTILLATLNVAFGSHQAQWCTMTFIGGMLFAFPAFRSLLPGNPPFGSLANFLSIFWRQAIAACCLITLVVIWNFFPGKSRY